MRSLGAGSMTLVHVIEPGSEIYSGYPTDAIQEDAQAARQWLRDMVSLAPGADGVLLEGHPPTAVTEWARTAGVDLLVAVRHRARVEHLLLGSFAQHLSYNAPCDVMLVHPPGPAG